MTTRNMFETSTLPNLFRSQYFIVKKWGLDYQIKDTEIIYRKTKKESS